MNLYDLIVLIILVLIAAMFWRIRAISEQVKIFLQQYCDKNNLQLISVARKQIKIGSYHGKLDFHCEYAFEFSGNGEDSYQGKAFMAGVTLLNFDTPAYKID